MGGLTQALAAAARDLGVDIRCNADVTQIVVQDDRVRGVMLKDGVDISPSRLPATPTLTSLFTSFSM